MQKRNMVIFSIALLLIGCATVPITSRKQLSIIPQTQLLTLSEENYKELVVDAKLSEDRKKMDMIVAVGQNIATAAETFLRENGKEEEIKNYRWEFNLIEDDKTVNAFCLPGGKIVVYTGILPIAQNKDGLAVIMGHEVAHALANHGGERVSQQLLIQVGGLTLSEAMKQKPEKTRKIAQVAFGVGTNLGVLLPYSRLHEGEADHIGLILMARAGYDPHAAVGFWERMSLAGGKTPPEFLSSHPANEARIANIRKLLPDVMKYYKKR